MLLYFSIFFQLLFVQLIVIVFWTRYVQYRDSLPCTIHENKTNSILDYLTILCVALIQNNLYQTNIFIRLKKLFLLRKIRLVPCESRIWNRIPYFGISRCALNKRSNIRFRRVLNKRSSAQPRLGITGVDIKKEFTSHHIFWPFSGVKQRRWKAWTYWGGEQ